MNIDKEIRLLRTIADFRIENAALLKALRDIMAYSSGQTIGRWRGPSDGFVDLLKTKLNDCYKASCAAVALAKEVDE